MLYQKSEKKPLETYIFFSEILRHFPWNKEKLCDKLTSGNIFFLYPLFIHLFNSPLPYIIHLLYIRFDNSISFASFHPPHTHTYTYTFVRQPHYIERETDRQI